MICKNCGEPIDEFIGKETGAKAYLHVINLGKKDDNIGYLWGWRRQSNNYCVNPEPEKEEKVKE